MKVRGIFLHFSDHRSFKKDFFFYFNIPLKLTLECLFSQSAACIIQGRQVLQLKVLGLDKAAPPPACVLEQVTVFHFVSFVSPTKCM
jgi:hypothetical protein